jgi:hypothetical protein
VKFASEITWEDDDPVLEENELAAASTGFTQTEGGDYQGTTIRIKLGDGNSSFSQLPYIIGGEVNTAENHNGIYRGKKLCSSSMLSSFISWLYNKVSNNDFSDLYLGDCFPVTITTTLPDSTTKTESLDLMIAGFNYYYNTGDTVLNKPHLVLIPRGSGFATRAKMNETNTTSGGYLNSYMHQILLPHYAESLSTVLNNHLLSHRSLLSNAVTDGASSGWSWATVRLQLMTEQQVYGSRIWSSSPYDVGIDYEKLPIFNFINPVHFGRSDFWIRTVASETQFALCPTTGFAATANATGSSHVRPIILFG